ncbi:retrovirus-related pol polyprotein from transposon TNT 1-94 [Tanacetum coccineum]
MTTLANYMIIVGADNRPPKLEKSLYDSWKSRMEHYMENRENNIMIINSVQNGPLIWPTVNDEDGLPLDVYAIFNHHKVTKEIWDRVKLLMQGMQLSLQEKECKLYDEFDKFIFMKGETLLPPEWSKFVTDVKLARDLHTTKYDQLYSYLEQHERHANETRLMRERYQDPFTFVANYHQSPSQLKTYHSQYNPIQFPQQSYMVPQVHSPQPYSQMYPPHHSSQPQISHSFVLPSQHYQSHQTSSVLQIAYTSPQPSTQPLTEFPQLDSGLAVLVFNQGDDPIACLNKAMAFLTTVASSRRQGQSYAGNSYNGNATSYGGNNAGGQARVVKCYNCQGEGYMARQCSQPKRTRNVAWFKEKAMLAEARKMDKFWMRRTEHSCKYKPYPMVKRLSQNNNSQTTAAFQNEDLDAYDSDMLSPRMLKCSQAKSFQLWF